MCTSHRWAPSGASSHTAADFGTISTSSEQLLTMQRPHLLRRQWLQLKQARPQGCSTGGTGRPTAGEGDRQVPSPGSCCKLEMGMVIVKGPPGPPVLSWLLFSGGNLFLAEWPGEALLPLDPAVSALRVPSVSATLQRAPDPPKAHGSSKSW